MVANDYGLREQQEEEGEKLSPDRYRVVYQMPRNVQKFLGEYYHLRGQRQDLRHEVQQERFDFCGLGIKIYTSRKRTLSWMRKIKKWTSIPTNPSKNRQTPLKNHNEKDEVKTQKCVINRVIVLMRY